ncbi:copper resistance protein NlpE N-terminal domain-containing protein [Paracandidimonas lactea]|uniref:copper resistance protein NlpE N-terminal domain-containing protein n=1 Tax=Paracandidimonas lactea TaxID=2895524 RepID=UPI001F3CED2B|nr:copper resistance protein NlpE N-terminal domain-containing protein [Paracandidimonas lactea]
MQRPAMPSRLLRTSITAATLLLALAACAQSRAPGYYDTGRESTQSDAQLSAQGGHYTQAPAQIQLGFGNQRGELAAKQGQAQAEAAPAAATPRELAEAKTYLGTVPCLTGAAGCPAQRLTLTLAPTGEWRARTHYLGDTAQPDTVEQGCWQVIGAQPTRILLQGTNKADRADLTFTSANVLRINMLNNIRPSVEYRLTRQANIDGIDELKGKAPLACRPAG